MPGKGEEYLTTRKKQIERRQRILTMVSIASFMGSMLFSTIPSIQQALQSPKPVAASVSPESLLQQQAKGYELVLQREPENQLALEKLSVLRLKLNDPKGAMKPLEKLVKLHPERQDYKTVLEQIKKQEGKGDSQTNNEPKSN
ncbi:hypothetical protein VF14_22660 [Nostoc linckia z18]|uniref:Tetratricopeptide repeat protein n=2 Tax=Nostoc linckia TaxID=92942 RepID=A0A9Q6EJU4_NOSLI|nr:tetratricopeptide repeat protein [Nostoc linckia]PHK39942.1 hypothetical protein VF12_12445 [Nostoc linckia z15]PHK47618.1 hypothetical protein VF13_04050 [Nostoc linckia z16]PHJ56813.1 hypothetical protein VF02_31955 [Nostoc linckia z1]PHJ62704.1 hypothetical protein VF03_31010 [Nostoc linckia z2]PHJ67397.1 hypothetical protein VF05_17425 [Nostoc linckia z3]